MVEPLQQPDISQANSNKKKWILGCGGCLVFIIILVALGAIAGSYVWKELQKTSNQTVQEVLGSDPPEGYVTFGAPLPATGGGAPNRMVFMMNQEQRLLMAMETVVSAQEWQAIRMGSEDAVKGLAEKFTQEGMGSTANAPGGVDVNDVRIEGFRQIKLANGKSFPALNAKLHDKSKGYTPAVVGLLPKGANQVVFVIAADLRTTDSSADANFVKKYTMLSADIHRLVSETTLDDRLVSGSAF